MSDTSNEIRDNSLGGGLDQTMLFVKTASGAVVAFDLSYLTLLIKTTESTGCCCQIHLSSTNPDLSCWIPLWKLQPELPWAVSLWWAPSLYLPHALCGSISAVAPHIIHIHVPAPALQGALLGAWAGQSREAQGMHRHKALYSTQAI